jgi:hypothetical protein
MRALGPFVWVIMLLLPPALRGQLPITFDTVCYGPVSYAIGYAVFQVDTGYLTFGLARSTTMPNQDIEVRNFNSAGGNTTLVSTPTVGADWIGSSGPMALQDGRFVTGTDRYQSGQLDSLFLQWYTPNGILMNEVFIDADTAMTMRGTAIESDGDVLLAGLHQYPEEAYIYHLDSLGNIKGFHGYPGFDAEDVAVGDNIWYLGGMGNMINNYSRCVLIGSDTLGQELWRYTDWSMNGRFLSLIPLRNGEVAAIGLRGEIDSNQRATISRFDPSGNVSWTRDPWQSDKDTRPCQFLAGYEATDSSLVLAGWYRDTTIHDAGMLFKLDALGNTLWHRFYTHYPGASFGKDQIFWDVKPTSDGGMVLTGETNSDAFPYAQLWLLKLDSAGCLVPGCGSVGVEEYVDDLNKHLRVWPNPASEVLNLSLTLPEGAHVQGNVRALLLDGAGRVVQEEVVRQDLNHLNANLNVSTLAAGTYYLHLRDGKRWLAGSAVVVTPP